MNESERIRHFLEPEQCQAIRDPVWKHIYIPDSFFGILSTAPFLKLQGIRQLGPASLVYPGATHTRFNHSIGVYHVATRFLTRLLQDITYSHIITYDGACAFLAASLMHDLGHFPYTHSLKELPLKDHEELTAELVLSEPIVSQLKIGNIDPQSVAAIVDKNLPTNSPEILFYRSVLSGVLDPDKLDYLNRDAYFCGVPYGIQDLDFILSRIRIHEGKQIGIDRSGVSAIEHVLFSKYLMYRAVYWHKTVRTATAMIKRALWLSLESGAIHAEELYHLDDAHFVQLAESRQRIEPSLGLVGLVQERKWLETLYEVPFNSKDPSCCALEKLEIRAKAEKQIAEILSTNSNILPYLVVIDIPEAVSFEVDMPVNDAGISMKYLNSGTVFTSSVVHDFTAQLRVLRVMADYDIVNITVEIRKAIADIILDAKDLT